MNNFSDTTVILPTLNEAQNIEELIKVVTNMFSDLKIIVADDGSKDDTQKLVNQIKSKNDQVYLLDRSKAKVHGLTASVLDAITVTTTPFFVVMDADFQHSPKTIAAFLSKLRKGTADIAIGTRVKVVGYWPWHRRALSSLGRSIGQIFLLLQGKVCHDVLSGFFAGKTDLAKKLITNNQKRFEPEGYKVLFDLCRVAPRSTKIAEVPYQFNERLRGDSKINPKHLLYYFRSFFK